MTDSRWLVPAIVLLTPLDHGKARLSVWTNGQNVKFDGYVDQVRDCQTQLLEAQLHRNRLTLRDGTTLRVGTGFEFDRYGREKTVGGQIG